MATDVVPIKAKIGLRPNGHADHPDWQKLPLAASADPASHMIAKWKYDKTSGHQEATPDSPRGMQWGMLLVTRQFADEALATFPEIITELSEAEAQAFWETKAHAHVPQNRADVQQLQALQAELSLREAVGQDVTALKTRISRALDPDDPEPGLRKNRLKLWADAKQCLDVSIKATP